MRSDPQLLRLDLFSLNEQMERTDRLRMIIHDLVFDVLLRLNVLSEDLADFGLRCFTSAAEGFRVLGQTQMHCFPEAGF